MNSFIGLLNNAALMLVLCVVYDTFDVDKISNKVLKKCITGILVGVISIGVMLTPWSIQPGVFFDTRWVLLSLCGLFFGFIPTFVAVMIAGVFRFYQGGMGAVVGTVVIVTTACTGLAWRYCLKRFNKQINSFRLYIFGISVQLVFLFCMFLFPMKMRVFIHNNVGIPILIIYPILTVLVGLILNRQRIRREVDKGLFYSVSLINAALESAVDGVLVVDRSGKINQLNNKFIELWRTPGHLMDAALGEPVLEYVTSCMKEPDAFAVSVRELYEHPERSSFDTLHLMDGRIFDCYSRPIKIGAKIVGRYWAFRDVSERYMSEQRINSMYEMTLYRFSTEHEFLDYALHKAIQLTGSAFGYIYFYSEKSRQFTLNTWSDGVMEQCAVTERNTVYDLDSTGLWGEAVRQRKPIVLNDFSSANPLKKGIPDGHIPLQRFMTVPVMVDGVIVAVIGMANKGSDYLDADVMQLSIFMDAVWKMVAGKRVEADSRKLEQQLLQAQKLESLGVLAGGIAHDFNNILMAIMGNADLALMRMNPESPAIDNLHNIEKSAARAADLARQMLAYSGKGRFVVETIDLNRLLEEMLHMLEVSISKKAVLRLNPYNPLPSVEADATQVRQIIMNLVINASEAIGDKSGVIAITTGCMDCDSNYLKDVWLDENISKGLYVYLEIADTGCGMERDTLAKVFDPFFTTKFTGRGLGMAAVLGIIRGHKGAIKVYSEPNKGTTFKVLLPASEKSIEAFSQESHSDSWKGSGKVLLVDDEETVRGIGSEMLKELGFDPITSVDGREALDVFRENPDIAFVILDLTMPHMDGEHCFRELRQLNPNVKVVMSSGYNEQEVTQKFVGKGLAGFIQKPYSMNTLKEAIRAL